MRPPWAWLPLAWSSDDVAIADPEEIQSSTTAQNHHSRKCYAGSGGETRHNSFGKEHRQQLKTRVNRLERLQQCVLTRSECDTTLKKAHARDVPLTCCLDPRRVGHSHIVATVRREKKHHTEGTREQPPSSSWNLWQNFCQLIYLLAKREHVLLAITRTGT